MFKTLEGYQANKLMKHLFRFINVLCEKENINTYRSSKIYKELWQNCEFCVNVPLSLYRHI